METGTLCMYLPVESLQRRVSANASVLLCSPPQCQPLVVWHGWSWWSCVLVKWKGSCPWMGEINPKDPEIQQIQHAIAPPSTNIAVPPPFLASVQKIHKVHHEEQTSDASQVREIRLDFAKKAKLIKNQSCSGTALFGQINLKLACARIMGIMFQCLHPNSATQQCV